MPEQTVNVFDVFHIRLVTPDLSSVPEAIVEHVFANWLKELDTGESAHTSRGQFSVEERQTEPLSKGFVLGYHCEPVEGASWPMRLLAEARVKTLLQEINETADKIYPPSMRLPAKTAKDTMILDIENALKLAASKNGSSGHAASDRQSANKTARSNLQALSDKLFRNLASLSTQRINSPVSVPPPQNRIAPQVARNTYDAELVGLASTLKRPKGPSVRRAGPPPLSQLPPTVFDHGFLGKPEDGFNDIAIARPKSRREPRFSFRPATA